MDYLTMEEGHRQSHEQMGGLMNMRDFFAGCALIGIHTATVSPENLELAAELAYQNADAMMKEREK